MGTPCNFASYLLKLHDWYYHDLQRYPLDWIVPHLAAICKAYFMAITCLYYKNFLQQGLAYTIYRLGQGTFKNCVENLEDQHPRRQHKHNQCNLSPHGLVVRIYLAFTQEAQVQFLVW